VNKRIVATAVIISTILSLAFGAESKTQNPVVVDRPFFSYSHSSAYKTAVNDLGGFMHQTELITTNGALILVQEYSNMNPTALVDRYLDAISEKDNEKYTYQRKPLSRRVGTTTLKGTQVIASSEEAVMVREVYAVGGKECGLMIVTTIDTKNNAAEQFLMDYFWKSLIIKKLD
jgi:hypothetical protein